MKRRKYKSLKTELIVIMLIGFVIAILSVLFYASWSQRRYAIRTKQNEAQNIAKEFAIKLNVMLSRASSTAKTMAQTFASVRNEEIPLEIDREGVDAVLSNVLLENPDYNATFCVWEKNAFDQNDEYYVNLSGHDKSGRLIPYVTRLSSVKTKVSPAQNYTDEGVGNYYLLPKKLMENVVIDPFFYHTSGKNDTIIAFVSPIAYKHFFLGAAGVNIKISHLQHIVKSANLYKGKASIALLSYNGIYVANSKVDTLVARSSEILYDNQTFREKLAVIQNGYFRAVFENNFYVIYTPIYIGDTSNPWQLMVSVPEDIIYKEATGDVTNIFLIGILIIIVTIFGLGVYINKIFNPLSALVGITQKIAKGSLDVSVSTSLQNEIGLVHQSIKDVVDSLKEVTEVSEAVSSGDYSKLVKMRSEDDSLAIAINKMNQSLKRAEEENEFRRDEAALRNWMSQGIAELGEILRKSTDNIEDLAIEVLQKIVNHLEAAQAGLFIINDKDPHNTYFELAGAFAYDRRKYFDKKILPGEGLVGTCAKEKETIYLTKIPDDYIEISSGFGSSKPHSLLLAPLKIEEETLGVIEISSFREFEKYEKEFVERASDSMALTVSTMKVNERTATLLAQSQKQAEELATQEQEMRQNLQELKSTQEESQKREAEMRGVLKALNVSSLVAEYDMSGKLIGMNDGFLKLFGMQRQQIIGKNFTEIGFLDIDLEIYEKLWDELRLGKNIKGREEHLKFPSGDNFWLSQTFTPILDEQGNPYKVLVVASDISERKLQEQELIKHAELLKKQKTDLTIKEQEQSAILNALNDVFITGEYLPDGEMIRLNDNFVKMSGYKREEILGQNLFDFIYGIEKKRFMKMWQGLLSGKSFMLSSERKTKTGDSVWVTSSYAPAIDEKGQVYKIYIIGLDITEYKRAEIEAQQRVEELEKMMGEDNEA